MPADVSKRKRAGPACKERDYRSNSSLLILVWVVSFGAVLKGASLCIHLKNWSTQGDGCAAVVVAAAAAELKAPSVAGRAMLFDLLI